MSNDCSDSLSKEKIRQLLAAMGKTTGEEEPIEAVIYDWRQPHYFNKAQLRKLDGLAEQAAASIAERLVQLYQGDVNVTVRAIIQQFGSQFRSETADDARSDYYLAFGSKSEPALGLVGLSQQTAIAWVTQLLCDNEPEKDSAHPQSELAGRALSQLEESLLTDVTVAVVEAFCRSLPGFHSFKPVQAPVTEQLPIELGDTAEICKFTFNVQKAGSEGSNEVYIVVPCGVLAPLVGKAATVEESISSEDVSNALLEHVQQMPVTVTAYLASTVFSFEGVMDLHASDILVFDNKINQPIDLTVEGQTLFRARPARLAGQYAVVITGLRDDITEDTNEMTEK
jgi:flagellar motor switch protein FliM